MARHWRSLLLLVGVSAVAWACSGDDNQVKVSTATGVGGAGAAPEHPWDKPVCLDPNKPLGATPSTRTDTAGALSADATQMVIFGGDSAKPMCPNIPPRVHEGDTWLLDVACGAWTQLTPATPPSARARHSMVQDPTRGRALLFGGRWRDNAASSTSPYTNYNDVWAFDFATLEWSPIQTTGTAPTPRSNTAIAVAGDRLIVFGGNTGTSGTQFTPTADTYALDLTTNTWSQIAMGAAPPARLFHTMTYDPTGNRIYIGTGGDENAFVGPFLADYWVLDLATEQWSELLTNPSFNAAEIQRIKGSLVYRPESEYGPAGLMAFGGHDNLTPFFDVRNDVRFIDLSTVTSLPPAGPVPFSDMRVGDVYNQPLGMDPCQIPVDYVVFDLEAPERRQGHALGVAHDGGAFVVFGGDADCDRLSDAWWFNSATGAWTPIRESPPGLSCPRTGNQSCSNLCG